MTRRYARNYQMSRDIDWFFAYGNQYYHVASNGGAIPHFLNVDEKTNIELQKEFANFPENIEHVTAITVRDNPNGLNYSSFIDYAKKGLISIDKLDDEFENQNYIVIAQPNAINDKIFQDFQDTFSKIPKLNNEDSDKIHVMGLNGEYLW